MNLIYSYFMFQVRLHSGIRTVYWCKIHKIPRFKSKRQMIAVSRIYLLAHASLIAAVICHTHTHTYIYTKIYV